MLTPIEQRVIEKAWERMGSAPDPHHPGFFACNHIDSQRWEALRAALFNESECAMNKTETTDVMHAFADCLRILYAEAGIEIPAEFHPEKEAERLKLTLRGYKEYPCGCFAGLGAVPDYCPEHGR